MASLKEIKGRIASVRSTLKITSAMKMVASAKLRKAQQSIGRMLPYERHLHGILMDAMQAVFAGMPSGAGESRPRYAAAGDCREPDAAGMSSDILWVPSASVSSLTAAREVKTVAIVALSSNSSLCGGFNANVIRETLAVVDEYRALGLRDSDITVYSVGRKMAEAMGRAGFPSPADFAKMSGKPTYEAAAGLAQELLDGFSCGKFDKVELVYNHYKSTSSQPTIRQSYLPLSRADEPSGLGAGKMPEAVEPPAPISRFPEDAIIEPDPSGLLAVLLPKVVKHRMFTALLDSAAAEHAARTVAMQTATDNGNELLSDLTLEYNKGRQQKITSEILDLVGGSLQ